MLFSRPFGYISPADIQQLCTVQYPHSDQVEYKQDTPVRGGGIDVVPALVNMAETGCSRRLSHFPTFAVGI
jgi:hypothetical protein